MQRVLVSLELCSSGGGVVEDVSEASVGIIECVVFSGYSISRVHHVVKN